jgi:anti-anti-sigma regulatory factor
MTIDRETDCADESNRNSGAERPVRGPQRLVGTEPWQGGTRRPHVKQPTDRFDEGGDSNGSPLSEGAVLVTTSQVIATCLVLSVRGKLAGTAITALEAQIDQIGCSDAKDVQLDLTELCGVDTRGLQVLRGMAEYVRARGGHLDITGASGPVARALAAIPEFTRAPED